MTKQDPAARRAAYFYLQNARAKHAAQQISARQALINQIKQRQQDIDRAWQLHAAEQRTNQHD